MMLKRTAKSCRSDAPMLVSSLREEAQATVSNKPGHREEHEVSRKTIARGMPGDCRCDRGDYARVLCFYHTRGCGRIERPAFPAPSDFRAKGSDTTRTHRAARTRTHVSRHCEERSDEAIHSYFAATWIASRSRSSGAHSRDPLARNDGIKTRQTFSCHCPRRAGDPVFQRRL